MLKYHYKYFMSGIIHEEKSLLKPCGICRDEKNRKYPDEL